VSSAVCRVDNGKDGVGGGSLSVPRGNTRVRTRRWRRYGGGGRAGFGLSWGGLAKKGGVQATRPS